MLPTKSYEGQNPATLTWRAWLFLVLTSLLTGVAYGFTPSMESGIVAGATQPQFPIREAGVSAQAEAQMAASLWPYVRAGMGESGDFLQDVRVYSVNGRLPGPPGVELDPRAAAACQQSFKAKRSCKIIRLQINPRAPSIVVSGLFANMLVTTNRFVGRPAFLVLELTVRRSFGVFDMELAGSDSAPEDNFASASRSVRMEGSFQGLAWLFLGNLRDYSYVENVALYRW